MKEQFLKEYPSFKSKMHAFVVSTHFNAKLQGYEKLFEQMKAITPDDMNESIKKSPDFVRAYNESLNLMEKIVSIHKELDHIFNMDEKALAALCQYDLTFIDKRVAQDLQEAARLLHEYHTVSQKGRKVVEMIEDPFLSQGM